MGGNGGAAGEAPAVGSGCGARSAFATMQVGLGIRSPAARASQAELCCEWSCCD
jgi:hypothetical protein